MRSIPRHSESWCAACASNHREHVEPAALQFASILPAGLHVSVLSEPRASAATVLHRFASLACCTAPWHVCCSAMPVYTRAGSREARAASQAHACNTFIWHQPASTAQCWSSCSLCSVLYTPQCSVYPLTHSLGMNPGWQLARSTLCVWRNSLLAGPPLPTASWRPVATCWLFVRDADIRQAKR